MHNFDPRVESDHKLLGYETSISERAMVADLTFDELDKWSKILLELERRGKVEFAKPLGDPRKAYIRRIP